jgi:hypothetical protein
MNAEIARNAMILLQRVDIKGGEAPVLMQVMQALQEIVDAKISDNPPMKLVSNE